MMMVLPWAQDRGERKSSLGSVVLTKSIWWWLGWWDIQSREIGREVESEEEEGLCFDPQTKVRSTSPLLPS